MAAGAGIIARLAPMLTRLGGTAVGQAAKSGAIQGVEMGVAGRTANMIQGRKDGQSGGQPRESLEGWFPGK
jgi:hypothetical protein